MQLRRFAPLIGFLALVVVLVRGLTLDPTDLPSARLGDRLPEFNLPLLGSSELDSSLFGSSVQGSSALESSVSGSPRTRNDNEWMGTPALINVWATWCVSCRVEHPYLLELADRGVVIYGLNYKDEADKAVEWLRELGNPYTETVVDSDGSLGLDLGVYGAPETYVIDARGVIRYRHVGVVNEQVWAEQLSPFFGDGS